jgi:N-acetyl-gamma-glutamyl-phosphate reductase
MNAQTHDKIRTIVLGGTGYVAGELLRLIAGHPHLHLDAVVSGSQDGTLVSEVFPHLAPVLGTLRYIGRDELPTELTGKVALFSAAPHGASAAMLAGLIETADARNCDLNIVDASADFRFTSAAAWEAVYGQKHGAPGLIGQFATGLPEHSARPATRHVGHPGCFATSMLLAAVPLLELGLIEPELHAVGITGSTGSGRTPIATTHHPFRHANLYAYKPLAHRHAPEVVEMCATATGKTPILHFIPHSGPFARGIHTTMQARLKQPASAGDIRAALNDYYANAPFVSVTDDTPRIKDVVGSNHAHLGVATDAGSVAIFCAIDNLLKGAAGGAVQWMNRLLGIDETTGLEAVPPGWI